MITGLQHKLRSFFESSRAKRITNLLTAVLILIWIASNLKFVSNSSSTWVARKYFILKLLFVLYLLQATLNKKWLNSLIVLAYLGISAFILYLTVIFLISKASIPLTLYIVSKTILKLILLLFAIKITIWLKPT